MARGNVGFTIGLGADYYSTLEAFRKLPKQASQDFRQEANHIGVMLAARDRAAAAGAGGQAIAAASTVRVLRDRFPKVRVGGSAVVASGGGTASELLFGSEFGGGSRVRTLTAPVWGGRPPREPYRRHTTRQFGPRSPGGRWWLPTYRRAQRWVPRQWGQALDRVIRKWSA